MNWTVADISTIVELSPRQVIHLSSKEILKPSVAGDKPPGKGRIGFYSDQDLLILAALGRVAEIVGTIPSELARAAVKAVRQANDLNGKFLLVDSTGTFVCDRETMFDVSQESAAMVIAFDPLLSTLERERRKRGADV